MASFIRSRNLERVFIFSIGAVLLYLFLQLFSVLRKDFEEVPRRLSDGSMINLNAQKPAENLGALLQKGFYFEDSRDINLIQSQVAKGLSGQEMDNIGELNKRAFEITTDDAYIKGGESFRKRARLARLLIGFSGDDSLRFEKEKSSPPKLPSAVNLNLGKQSINGTVQTRANAADEGVLVRLQMILPQDSIYNDEVADEGRTVKDSTATVVKTYAVDSANHRQLISLAAYARTDVEGKFSFGGLPADKAFEVLPLKPGSQFGGVKGVSDLEEDASFRFTEAPHTIRLFSTRDFNNLRKEKALIVRTPEEVTKWYWTIVVVFFAGFLLLHFFLSFRFPSADQLLLPVIMLLTGISFLTLLSLQDPLRDRFFGKSTLFYFAGGIIAIFIILLFNLKKFTTDSGLFRLFVFKKDSKAANGWPWALGAMGLLVMTILFGTGPEGSGVKVNLFGFQPSEIVKYLIVVFLAGFFATNEKFISEYGRWQKRWQFFGFALIAILGAIFLFLILGDLGPAMVACFTFIILFSFSRGDFAYAVATAAVYVITIWLTDNIWIATAITVGLLLLTVLFIKKQLAESAIMLLVVMSGFLLLDKIPYIEKVFPGPVQRLVDRKAIWQNPWDNEVFGGDQIANGLWAMSSGGVSGQGIGEGFAKTIPEAHTDMILPSMGEEFGWAGIVCVFIVFLLYLHRAILVGRQTGTPFLFYLCAGIGTATFVQFLLIAGGSIGALPLSGVSLPFMSYGGSSLIMNMIAAGFLLSASVVQGSPVQMKFISKQQDHNLMPALLAALVGVVLLGVNVGQYLFNNKKWVTQPALVADRSGARMFSYNPRIAILMNRLGAGNLLDRNGRVMATGNPDAFLAQQDSLIAAGVNPASLQALSHKRLDRYYPFYESAFFWTGDMNTGVFMGGTNGYFAEYEHMPELRGFPAPETKFIVKASRFRENRFLPQTETEMTVAKRDFSALAPLLIAGINSKEVDSFKKQNRDVQMTVDAALQNNIQAALQKLDTLKNSRISVVVIEDNTGDVLASAMYPAAPVNDMERMTLTNAEQNRLPYFITTKDLGFTYASQPGSTAKLITASAAFNKLGTDAASKKTIRVRPEDLIRVKSEEPDETGNISIERGIVKSNNPFFIRLANEERLEEEMGSIYMNAGLFLRGIGGYFYDGDFANAEQQQKWMDVWRKTEFTSIRSYNKDNIRRTRGRGISGMAWGQGELIATPASIARIASAIANNGMMMHSRYVMKVSDSAVAVEQGVPLLKDAEAAKLMTKFMREQSANKKDKLNGLVVAGKTGTPERILKGERINDGWYVFFAPKAKGEGHIVVCVRIEKTRGSSVAVRLAGSQVIPALQKYGYIKSFEAPLPPKGGVANAQNPALR